MLPPHELKNKTFSRAMRGYNPAEVDEYIDFLIEKYTELYRENDELERKLKLTATHLDELRSDEDSIRGALVDAQKAASRIKADAEVRAESIIRSAKSSCNAILSDFNTKIASGRETLEAIRSDTLALRQELYERYCEHIHNINQLTEHLDAEDLPDPNELRKEAVEAIKQSIVDTYTAEKERKEADPVENLMPTVREEEPAPVEEYDEEAPLLLPETEEEMPEEIITEDVNTLFGQLDEAVPKPGDLLTVERMPLMSKPKKNGIKDSITEINRAYRENSQDDIVHTPDSDPADEQNYQDFLREVTGKEDEDDKSADFDLVFQDIAKKNKKKK